MSPKSRTPEAPPYRAICSSWIARMSSSVSHRGSAGEVIKRLGEAFVDLGAERLPIGSRLRARSHGLALGLLCSVLQHWACALRHDRRYMVGPVNGSTNPPSLHMRQPPAERVRFILILKLLGLLHAWLGEWLRTLAHRLAGEGVDWSLHPHRGAGEIQIGKKKMERVYKRLGGGYVYPSLNRHTSPYSPAGGTSVPGPLFVSGGGQILRPSAPCRTLPHSRQELRSADLDDPVDDGDRVRRAGRRHRCGQARSSRRLRIVLPS